VTSPVPPSRRSLALWGWPLVVLGWLGVALAPVLLWTTGVPVFVPVFPSALLVAAGCVLIGFRGNGDRLAPIVILTFIVGGMLLVIGVGSTTDQFVYRALGKTATCRVTGVRKLVTDGSAPQVVREIYRDQSLPES
jgi:hypothetical protein